MSDLIIDIGGGFYRDYGQILASNPNLQLILFEPHPERVNEISGELFQSNSKISNSKISNTEISNTEIYNDRIHLHKLIIVPNDLSDGVSKKTTNETTNETSKLYLMNDPPASSTSPLTQDGPKKWKNPLRRPPLKCIKEVDVPSMTLEDYLLNHPNMLICKYNKIKLFVIDIQDGVTEILRHLSHTIYRRCERIIVKCIVTDFKLYSNQSAMTDITTILKSHGFAMVHYYEYSRGQEKYIEFVDLNSNPTNSNTNSIIQKDFGGFFIKHI